MIRLLLLGGVYVGIQHYTGHNCIAISSVCALLYLNFSVKAHTRWLS